MDLEDEGDRSAIALAMSKSTSEVAEYMDLRSLMKAISDAFGRFFEGRVDGNPRARTSRIGRFVKEEMGLHSKEMGKRMKVHVDDVLEKDDDFPYNCD